MSTPPGYGFGLLLTGLSLPLALWTLYQVRYSASGLREGRYTRLLLGAGSLAIALAFCYTALNFGFVFGKGFGDGFGDGYMRALPLLCVEFGLLVLFLGTAVAVVRGNR